MTTTIKDTKSRYMVVRRNGKIVGYLDKKKLGKASATIKEGFYKFTEKQKGW